MSIDTTPAKNAKLLSYKQLVETFVNCPEYEELKKENSSVVLGPRGCGKTTLMRMLTPEAQSLVRPSVPLPFIAIYIQCDVQSSQQLDQVAVALKNHPTKIELVLSAVMTLNIQLAISSSLCWLCENCGTENAEVDICKTMIDIWKLPNTAPFFVSIKLNLRKRLSYLQTIVSKAQYDNLSNDTQLEDWCHNNEFINLSTPVLDQAFISLGLYTRKWAFCFDELEFAPRSFQNMLFNIMRGIGNSNIILKITSTPLPEVKITTGTSYIDDYDVIQLWSSDRNDRFDFLCQLFETHLLRLFPNKTTLTQFLGHTEVSPRGKDKEDNQYQRGSNLMALYAYLASNDPSFHEYLLSFKISPNAPGSTNPHMKDTVLRKIKPLVYQRLNYGPWTGSKRSRTRKWGTAPATIYTGYEAIIYMCEGNPRRLIRIMSNLYKEASDTIPMVTHSKQGTCVKNESNSFASTIKSHPIISEYNGNEIHMFSLIKKIGEYFYKRIVLDPFSADPPGTFTVDDKVDDNIVQLISKAVDCGALVMCTPFQTGLHTSVRNQRFRVSFMLAPLFKLPLRTYSPTHLSSIMNSVYFEDEKSKIKNSENELDLWSNYNED